MLSLHDGTWLYQGAVPYINRRLGETQRSRSTIKTYEGPSQRRRSPQSSRAIQRATEAVSIAHLPCSRVFLLSPCPCIRTLRKLQVVLRQNDTSSSPRTCRLLVLCTLNSRPASTYQSTNTLSSHHILDILQYLRQHLRYPP